MGRDGPAELQPPSPSQALAPAGVCTSLLGHSWEPLGNHLKALLFTLCISCLRNCQNDKEG